MLIFNSFSNHLTLWIDKTLFRRTVVCKLIQRIINVPFDVIKFLWFNNDTKTVPEDMGGGKMPMQYKSEADRQNLLLNTINQLGWKLKQMKLEPQFWLQSACD